MPGGGGGPAAAAVQRRENLNDFFLCFGVVLFVIVVRRLPPLRVFSVSALSLRLGSLRALAASPGDGREAGLRTLCKKLGARAGNRQ